MGQFSSRVTSECEGDSKAEKKGCPIDKAGETAIQQPIRGK